MKVIVNDSPTSYCSRCTKTQVKNHSVQYNTHVKRLCFSDRQCIITADCTETYNPFGFLIHHGSSKWDKASESQIKNHAKIFYPYEDLGWLSLAIIRLVELDHWFQILHFGDSKSNSFSLAMTYWLM